jgi:broad specificity phosphatase PhoE
MVAPRALGLLWLAHATQCRASSSTTSTRTVYLVRHAESRWNAAWKRLNVAAMLRETDHGLTVVGVDQAGTLAAVLLAPPISIAQPGAQLASSPLCRALQTAAVAVVAARPTDAVRICTLPDARESGGRLGFGRDSAGTPTGELVDNLLRELHGSGAHAAAAALKRGAVSLDMSALEREGAPAQWWLPLESKADRHLRLRRLLAELFRLAESGALAQGAPTRLVLVSHSFLIRDLCREHVDERAPFAQSALRATLAKKTVANCAVLALDLAQEAGETGALIVGARLLTQPSSRVAA